MSPRKAHALKSLFGGEVARKRAEALRAYCLEQGIVCNTGAELLGVSDAQLAHIMQVACGKALAGTAGGQAREQTVFTPRWLLDCLIAAAGPIMLDPCTTADNPVGAAVYCTEQTNGLIQPWHKIPGMFYANPPFADLEAWLDKARKEWVAGATGYMLAPTRTQRTWFAELTAGLPVVHLRPFAFVGSKSSFPAPLCLICYGAPVPSVTRPGRVTKKNPNPSPIEMVTQVTGV
jgi:hypothetical protein